MGILALRSLKTRFLKFVKEAHGSYQLQMAMISEVIRRHEGRGKAVRHVDAEVAVESRVWSGQGLRAVDVPLV